MKTRANLGVGTLVLVLGACDTLSEPGRDGITFIDDPDASNTSGTAGGAGTSTAGVAGTGGTTLGPLCPARRFRWRSDWEFRSTGITVFEPVHVLVTTLRTTDHRFLLHLKTEN